MKNIMLAICLSVLGLFAQAQNGLENVYVETYYISNSADNTGNTGSDLPIGSVTYRIYADMLPGYKLQSIFGSTQHPLSITTNTEFFNSAIGSSTGLPTINVTNTKSNTNMIDSYLTTGKTCTGYVGVPKTEDNGTSNATNIFNNGALLQNNDILAGDALTVHDGMWLISVPATVPSINFVGDFEVAAEVFGDGSVQGSTFTLTGGAWTCTTGASGAIALTNRVLLAQITTDGTLQFELNIQIGTPTGGTQKYVSSDPTGVELTIPSLTFPVASCASTIWNGTYSNNWFDVNNWTACVPQEATVVTIPAGVTYFPTLTSAAACASLTIESGASFIGSEFLTVGNVLVKQNFPATTYHYISSPVQSTTFNNVMPLNQNSVWAYSYNEATGDWINQTLASVLGVGTGYSVKMNVAQTAQYAGQLNQSPVTKSLSFANTLPGPGSELSRKGYNLLGNPFTSALNWTNVVKTNTDGAVYVFNGSGYLSYAGGIGSITGGIIPSTNGFFVKALNASASITIPLEARVHSNIPDYKESVAYLLSLKADANNYTDETFVNFNQGATSGFDSQYDAYKLMGIDEAPELYSLISSDMLSINALPEQEAEVVNLGFKCGISGSYTITASGMESFNASTPIWLQDLKTGLVQDLRTNQTFTFDYAAGDNELRFKLHFSSATGIQPDLLNGISVNSANKSIVIRNTSSLAGDVYIFDLNGRELLHASMNSQNETIIPVNCAMGTYFVKVITSKGVVNNKVVIR